MRRRWSLIALAVLVVASAVAAPSVLAVQDAQSSSEHSIEELRDGGTVISEEYPSVRRSGDEAWWLVRYPPSGLNSYGSGAREFISASSVVRRDRVRLISSAFDAAGTTSTFKIVYWTPQEQQVTTGNSTSTRTVANVQDTQTVKATYRGAFKPHADIPLRKYFDGPVHVTVWSTERPEDLRWTFQLETIATAQPVNIDSTSELYDWLLVWNFLPGLVMLGAVSIGVPKFRDLGGAGPQRLGTLIGGGLFAGLAIFVMAYVELASLVAAIPLVFPALIAYVAGCVLLHDSSPVKSIGLVQFDTEAVQSPVDEDAEIMDAMQGAIEGYDVVEMPNGDLALYEDGFKPFWARLHGCYTRLNIPNQEARIEMDGDYDELVFVDEDQEALIDHQPEQVLLAWPWKTFAVDEDVEDADDLDPSAMQKASVYPETLGAGEYIKTGVFAGVFALACLASRELIGTWVWGVTVAFPLALAVATPVKGHAHTTVAAGQARPAYTTAFYADYSVQRFQTIPDLLREVQRQSNKQLDVKQLLQQIGDESVIKRANDPDASPFQSELVENDPAVDEDGESFAEQVEGDG